MGRLDSRIRRLKSRIMGRHATYDAARIARMSGEEVEAELAKAAIRLGMPEEVARADPEAVMAWLSEYYETALQELPEKDRDKMLAGTRVHRRHLA